MSILLGIGGIVLSFFMLKYRESIGDMLGEADWMRKIGGVHFVVVIIAVFIFFWSLAEMTGTTNLLFKPLLFLFPGGKDAMNGPQVTDF